MLSTLSVTLPSEGLFGNIQHEFDTLWDYQETLFPFSPPNEPVEPVLQYDEPFISSMQIPEPVLSHSCSENSNPVPINPISSPDEMGSPEPGSDEPNQKTCIMEDRKQRRKLSNRESARRSRVRKQRHLENVRNQVTGLMMGNKDLMNRLRLVTHHYQLARSENQRLRSESNILRQRLWNLRQVMLVRELHQMPATNLIPSWPCNNDIITSIDGQQMMPLSLHT